MAIDDDIAEMERGLSGAGRTVKDLCDAADVSQSTWTRWKAGSNSPTFSTWQKVRQAYEGFMTPQQQAS